MDMDVSSKESGEPRPSIGLHKVAVVGTGKLGTRIAGELALCGCTVRIHDQNSVNLQTVHSRIAEHFQEMIQSGLLPHHFQLQGSVIVESVLSSAVSDADIVVEAVVDNMDIKRSIFRDISSLCSERTILCTNSLNLSLAEVFYGVPLPGRTVGVRFLYPVYLIDRVEITAHHSTSDTTTKRVTSFLQGLGKTVFHREAGDSPVKLTTQQALELQKERAHLWPN